MSNLGRIAIALIILCMFGAFSIVFADGQSAPQVTDSPSPSSSAKVTAKASTTTVKATIAPIETREPSVKPPSVGTVTASPSTSISATPSVMPTATRTEISTTEPTASPDPSDDTISASSYFQWGLAFERQGEYKAAMSEFEKSLARDPQNLNTWYHLGICAEALGYMEQAYNAYVYVLQIDPTFAPIPNTEGESVLFPQLQANVTPPEIPTENEAGRYDWFTYVLMGALLVIIALFAVSYIVRQHYYQEPVTHVITIPSERKLLSPEKINEMADKAMKYFDGDREIVVELLTIASEIAAEGREGKHVGTAFILGDTDEVLESSRQLILNPFEGHTEESRSILDPRIHENIKELAQMDGAFIIRDDGIVIAAGRYISIDTSEVRLPAGFGTRHVSTAAITEATDAIGIVVSESGGCIRVLANGTIIASNLS